MTSSDFDWKTLMAGDILTENGNQDHSLSQTHSLHNNQHLSIPSNQESSTASTSSLSQPRLTRPASSSSYPSVSSSPGPTRPHSSPPQQARSTSKRFKNRRTEMDVKVLYTLDSHPNSTLMATLGRPTSIQVVSLGKKGGKKASSLFGKVTLKTCLNAICMASPELMIDRRQDYILYAVDPIESYRASQRGESGTAKTGSTSTRNVETKRSASEMNEKSKTSAASAFIVGKGFFTWALAEEGDGQSLVHGRVRDEYADEEEDESNSEGDDDDDLQGKVLEVSLRLKAASNSSRDQFFDRVKVFQSSATTPAGPIAIDSPQENSDSISNGKRRGDVQRSVHPQSASSPVTASEREQVQAATATTSTPAQRQLLHFLQALQAQAASTTAAENTLMPPEQQPTAQRSPGNTSWQQPLASQAGKRNSTSTGSPDAMSNLLRSLTAATSSTNTERSPHLGVTALPSKLVNSFATPRFSHSGLALETKGTQPESAPSPILGGLTPGYEPDYLSGPSPSNITKASVPGLSLESADANQSGSKVTTDSNSLLQDIDARMKPRVFGSNRSRQCCYNCGVRSQRSWRHLTLTNKDLIRFEEGSIVYDHGKKLHRACNACGLYFNKYSGISRPEHVWKEAQRLKREQHKESEKAHGSKCNCSTGEDRTQSSAEDGDHKQSSALARTKQIARTLSEACERDMSRLLTVCGEDESDQETIVGSAPPRKMASFEEARLKDLVQDGEGVWRTKRSILENPENKRPGRPKGSKTGQGQGRPRERHLRNKGLKTAGQEQQRAAKVENRTASSPGAGPESVKMEHTEGRFIGSLLAQSSPVRASNFAQMAKTPGSAVNRARYGAPNYLLDSSPATAFQTVLNEAETDWHTLCGLSPRRSPRKNPHGTQSGLNPYATIATSPSGKGGVERSTTTLSTFDLMKMTSSSPLTRSRVKSGQYQLDDSWFSSEGFDFGGGDGKKTASSSLTSPGSPSPSPAQLKHRGVKRKSDAEIMLQPGQRSMQRGANVDKNGQQLEVPLSAERARKAARQARQAAAAGGTSNNSSDAGPFMGLDVAETVENDGDGEDEEEEAGRGSPTLGRSRRMRRKSDLDSLSLHASPTSGEAMMDFNQDWTRSASMRELFPTPSPVKQWSMNDGLWQSPTSWAIKPALPSPAAEKQGEKAKEKEKEQTSTALVQLDDNKQQLVRRKPLPATVEDAPSSVNSASSSPMEEDDMVEDGEELQNANLMDLFEDPYGLLAASGIGGQGTQPGLSMEDFDSIELFKGVDFGQQLDFFTQMGSNGIAAHVAPNQGTSSTLKIEGKGMTSGEVATIPPQLSPTSAASADFAALLKDPAMQALLAHMQLSPSKTRQAAITASNQNNTIASTVEK